MAVLGILHFHFIFILFNIAVFLHFSKLDFGHSSYSRRLKIVLWFSGVYMLTTKNLNIYDREVFSNSPFFITADDAGSVEARFILFSIAVVIGHFMQRIHVHVL